MYFVLGYSQLTVLWQFPVNSEGTYKYMYPFSPKPPSHPGSHITPSRVVRPLILKKGSLFIVLQILSSFSFSFFLFFFFLFLFSPSHPLSLFRGEDLTTRLKKIRYIEAIKYLLCVHLVAQLCPTLCNPMDYSLTGSSLQTKILEWVVMPFSRGSSQPREGSNPGLPSIFWNREYNIG